MASRRKVYTAEFQRQMVDLVRSGRKPGELSREFGPTPWTIRKWSQQIAMRSVAMAAYALLKDFRRAFPPFPPAHRVHDGFIA